jgi:hypothetical protein
VCLPPSQNPQGNRGRIAKKKPSDAVAIVSYDEKPGIQAIATTAPDLPPEPGVHAAFARDHEYKRLGTVGCSGRPSAQVVCAAQPRSARVPVSTAVKSEEKMQCHTSSLSSGQEV